MANAANSPFVKHPALLALFAPRPPPPFKPPMPKKAMPKLTGIAEYTASFGKEEDIPPAPKQETPTERRERVKKEKDERHLQILAERESKWDPHNNPNATKDPYKTLFVARLSYELTEDDLRREFERYGRIRDIKLILDKNTQKSRGYAFIEFERSNDLKEAFQHADGHKLKGRRILVDVERGRTVGTWKPRKLGGGLGKTRAAPNINDKNKVSSNNGVNAASSATSRHSSSRHHRSNRHEHGASNRGKNKDGKYSSRRDKYRDRDYRDRDRRSGRSDRKERERGGDRDRDRDRERERDRDRTRSDNRERERERKRSRSRSRDRKDRSKRRDKKDNKERDRDRDRGRDRDRMDRGRGGGGGGGGGDIGNNNNNNDMMKYGGKDSRKDRDNKDRDRDRSRRRRSKSKEKNRRR